MRRPSFLTSAIFLTLAAPTMAAAQTPAATTTPEPLAGFTGDTAFIRSSDNNFVLFPNGRLQVDWYKFLGESAKNPNDTFLIKRARLELAGWIGPWFFFYMAGDFAAGVPSSSGAPVAQSQLNATDDFIAIVPKGDLAILQIGQFDAPFTLENRTSDKYFDFMERSLTVRAFGIPTNKEQGAMLHGMAPLKAAYYSIALLNGDGQNYRNVDNNFDLMGRGWVAPGALVPNAGELSRITVGGSFWTGRRQNALALPKQTTQGGYSGFFSSSWKSATTPYELRQDGWQQSWALELNAPITHRLGARAEYVHKHQHLAESDVTDAAKPVIMGRALLEGWSVYGEAWAWLLGNDTILPDPGLQLPSRYKGFTTKGPQHGLMLAARVERLQEEVSNVNGPTGLGDPALGTTNATSFELGLNYWYSKRFRATVNYVVNHFSGTASSIAKLPSANEHELGLRLAIAL